MTILDRPFAAVAKFAVALSRRGRWLPWAVVVGLVTLSLIPVLIVGATPQPTDISFDDLRAGRIPPLTSWLRLEGDLRRVPDPTQNIYTLHDARNDAVAVTVVADSPLQTGPTQVTGRISGEHSAPGTFTTIHADVPAEPGRHDPWLLFAIPALLAIPLLLAMRAGYPVVRRDPAPGARPAPLSAGETLPAQWSGRIGSESAPLDRMRPCSVGVVPEADVCRVSIDDGGEPRVVTTRRAATRKRVRICWVDGCRPALDIRGPGADVILAFDAAETRDRFAAALA